MQESKQNELLEIINNYRAKSLTEITRKGFISSAAYNVILNNGKEIIREKLLKGGKDGSAVIVIPVLEDGNILTVVEPRTFTKETVGIGFPAGYIEINEDPKVAAFRELREETGFVPSELIELDAFYQDEGCSAAYNYIYLATGCIKQFNQALDQDEIVTYLEFSYDDILELEEKGFIKGGNSKLAIAKAYDYFKGERKRCLTQK